MNQVKKGGISKNEDGVKVVCANMGWGLSMLGFSVGPTRARLEFNLGQPVPSPSHWPAQSASPACQPARPDRPACVSPLPSQPQAVGFFFFFPAEDHADRRLSLHLSLTLSFA